MSFPLDATMNDIVRDRPVDYGETFGAHGRPTRLLNVDLSTLSAASDVVLGFGEPLEEILDINFQSGPDRFLASRVEMYRAVLHHQYHLPVRTLLVLMRPQADHANFTGIHSYGSDTNGVQCRYEMLRLWNESPQSFLKGRIGLGPLSVLCKLPEGLSEEAAIAAIVREP